MPPSRAARRIPETSGPFVSLVSIESTRIAMWPDRSTTCSAEAHDEASETSPRCVGSPSVGDRLRYHQRYCPRHPRPGTGYCPRIPFRLWFAWPRHSRRSSARHSSLCGCSRGDRNDRQCSGQKQLVHHLIPCDLYLLHIAARIAVSSFAPRAAIALDGRVNFACSPLSIMSGRTGWHEAIFITGGGSAIGRATWCNTRGAGLVRRDRRRRCQGIDEKPPRCFPTAPAIAPRRDVRDRDQWKAALVEFAAASGGRLDVLFNNAGIGSGGQFLDMPPEEADRLIGDQLAASSTASTAMPLLRATPGSAILNTGSASLLRRRRACRLFATGFAVRGLTEGRRSSSPNMGSRFAR